jgi:hypothetical protein
MVMVIMARLMEYTVEIKDKLIIFLQQIHISMKKRKAFGSDYGEGKYNDWFS